MEQIITSSLLNKISGVLTILRIAYAVIVFGKLGAQW